MVKRSGVQLGTAGEPEKAKVKNVGPDYGKTGRVRWKFVTVRTAK
jgi:hypothetical protein